VRRRAIPRHKPIDVILLAIAPGHAFVPGYDRLPQEANDRFQGQAREYAYVPSFWGMLIEMPRMNMRKVFSGLEIRGI
jgi:hypothetical protein